MIGHIGKVIGARASTNASHLVACHALPQKQLASIQKDLTYRDGIFKKSTLLSIAPAHHATLASHLEGTRGLP